LTLELDAAGWPFLVPLDAAGNQPPMSVFADLDAWQDPDPPLAAAEDHLAIEVQAALSEGGAISRAEPQFRPRESQTVMALAVAQAICAQSTLVVEAGTGVGKTFAYLLPILLSGRRALVSTATKNLQDQLFFRDLPRLSRALTRPVHLALLKGRSSYLCRHRLALARQDGAAVDRAAARSLVRIERWAQATSTGDLGELEGLDERSEMIPLITSTRDNCLGSDCADFQDCHVMKARRDAMAADVVVVNHHLFFADLALRDSGVAELLPTVDVAVFDEAHQMVETGVQFLGLNLGTGQVLDFARDLLAAGLQKARGLADWAGMASGCELAARDLRLKADGPGSSQPQLSGRVPWEEIAAGADGGLANALSALATALQRAALVLEAHSGAAPDLARLLIRAHGLAELSNRFLQPVPSDRVRWVDLTPHQIKCVESPLDIRSMLSEQRDKGSRAWIFTSATLGDDEELTWFTAAAGLENARKLRLSSPFDYANQARLYVPPKFPSPSDATHPGMVGRAAAHCAHALGGRTFVLTTTLRAMRLAAETLQTELTSLGSDLVVLLQGSAPKRSLLAEFEAGGCVLVGSHSFWEGIDMPGDALECVVIDKLPFPPPNDPLVEARVRQLKLQGRDSFTEYFLAEAAVALKQGAGRLIRHENDRGLLVVCDVRLLHARYGARLIRALPPMLALSSGPEALAWLRELALSH
jgi:ATP-dependent DNA helicase DinG